MAIQRAMYCEPIEEWKHITANKQKRQKVLDLLGAFAYLQTVRHNSRTQGLFNQYNRQFR